VLDSHLIFEPGAGGLSAEERTRVCSFAAEVKGTETQAMIGGGQHKPNIRRSRVSWLELSEQTQWLFSRVFSLAHAANTEAGWDFEIVGPSRSLQLAEYDDVELGTFDWHLDIGSGKAAARKISVAIEIESAEEGGVLQFRPGSMPRSVPKRPGLATVFPAYLPHRLTPVTRGRRLSLVAWICGPQFR
jgi:PKHD-type hydroxylase